MSLHPPIFLATDIIYGKTYQHWIEKYWNTYGWPDILRARGPVYCLPGRIPEVEKEQKRIHFTIKQNKAIMLSPMNFIRFTQDIERVKQEEHIRKEIKRMVSERMDVIQELRVNLDGKNIADKLVRIATEFFELDGKTIAISDGFWLFLQPRSLTKGEHTIDTFSSCSAGETQLPLFYKVTIV